MELETFSLINTIAHAAAVYRSAFLFCSMLKMSTGIKSCKIFENFALFLSFYHMEFVTILLYKVRVCANGSTRKTYVCLVTFANFVLIFFFSAFHSWLLRNSFIFVQRSDFATQPQLKCKPIREMKKERKKNKVIFSRCCCCCQILFR